MRPGNDISSSKSCLLFQTRTHRMVQGAAAGCFCFYISLVCVKLPGACGKSTAELQFYYICCVPLLLQLTNGSCDEISSGVARVPSSLLSLYFAGSLLAASLFCSPSLNVSI